MIRRAASSPRDWSGNLLLALGVGAVLVVLGCGGGGGGGNNNGNNGNGGTGAGACGSQNGAGTVVCGYVVDPNTQNGVNGATVTLKTAAGTAVGSADTTKHNPSVQGASPVGDGFYKITVPNNAAPTLIEVDAPAPDYIPGFMLFAGKVYDFQPGAPTPASGGQCIPAIGPITTGTDNQLANIGIYSNAVPPPLPSQGCPRQ